MQIEQVRKIISSYYINADDAKISAPIDSSRGDGDVRLAYVIGDKFVLHCYSSDTITEQAIQSIYRLVMRHREIGVWAPLPVRGKKGLFLQREIQENLSYSCYLEEFAPYAFLNENTELYSFKAEMLPFLGKLATRYTGIDLSNRFSMWSILDRSPYDGAVDEKQENIDELCHALGDHPLADRLQRLNRYARGRILSRFGSLPRCVFQGDLNSSNILVDEQNRFKGIIDFNLFGTDVNINCFLNESMYFLNEADFLEYASEEIIEEANKVQDHLMTGILRAYRLSSVEKEVLEDYRFVIAIGFYPNVQRMIQWLALGAGKVIRYLELLCDRYENLRGI